MRHTLLLVFAALLVVVAPGVAQRPPNVVLVLSDDQHFGDFGFMGSAVVRTPHLDRLAAEGMVFPRAYVPASLCRPSLMSIATGLLPHVHGVTGNDPPKGTPRDEMLRFVRGAATLPRLLAPLGYRSLQTGKWWEGSFGDGGFTDGMTHGDPARGGRHGDAGLAIGRKGLAPIGQFLDEVGTSPFLLWYAPMLPHAPHDAPDELVAQYRADGRSEGEARYYANCERFDATVGELLAMLDARGHRDDTLVVFVVDNGWIQDPTPNRFAPRSKRSPYEGGVRTPILVRWPGHVRPGRSDVVVSSLDIAPTVLRAVGAPVPRGVDGVDLVAVAAGAVPARAGIVGETFAHDVVDLDRPERGLEARFVVVGREKLIEHAGDAHRVELFDVVDDPTERSDLAAERPERVAALRRQLARTWQPDAGPRRPNLLFVLTDDQRFDQLSCAGHPTLATPNIDRIAARGVRFTEAFVTTSICAASRATIFTGLVESAHHFTFGTPPIAAEVDSYPARLRAAGYRTGFVGKFGVKIAADPATWFDWFRPMNQPFMPKNGGRHLTDRTGDAAIAFLRDHANEPFCLSVSFNAPHAEDANPEQYVPPPDLAGRYADAPVPVPVLDDPAFFAALPEFMQKSENRVRYGWRFDTPEKRATMTRRYWEMIAGVDRVVGRLLDELELLGIADDTIVVFTSDNGYFLGERGFAGKWTIHELSLRVPLIVADPRRGVRGTVDDHVVLNLDLASTLLDLAGVPVPDTMQGRSLAPLVRGEPVDAWRDEFFYEHRMKHARIAVCEGVRGPRYTYVRYVETTPQFEELYDRDADPLEAHNLASDPAHAALLATLRARTEALHAAVAR